MSQSSFVASRLRDIRALVRSHPSFKAAIRNGVEIDDLLQEVLLSIHAKQQGASAYDPSRGSLGKYIFVCTTSAVANHLRTLRDRKETIYLDDPVWSDDRREDVHIPEDRRPWASSPEHAGLTVADAARALASEMDLDDTDAAILRALAAGEQRGAIRKRLGLPTKARAERGVVDRVALLVERVAAHTGMPARQRGYGPAQDERTHMDKLVGTSGVGLTRDTVRKAIREAGEGGSFFLAPTQCTQLAHVVAWPTEAPLSPGLALRGHAWGASFFEVADCEVINGGNDYQGWYVGPGGERVAVISKAA